MFIDEVKLKVEAGRGGDGIIAFRREKYVPLGGPSGGDGGRGGDIIFKVDEGLSTLMDLRYQKIIKGNDGERGGPKNFKGKDGEDVVIKVPPGTIVKDINTNKIIADLKVHGEEKVIARGGRGGRGNKSFATRNNPAPNISEKGEPGEVREILVELKLLADVGLIGFPSVGKSTFLSIISAARPKIAPYPFTTLVPNLGVVETKDHRSFVVADLPGLIKGASEGAGLGHEFLKHIERTRILIHIIDMSGSEGRDPYEDFLTINAELEKFNKELLKRSQVIVANKMDILGAEENLKKFKEKVTDYPIFQISAIKGRGKEIEEILYRVADILENTPLFPLFNESEVESKVVYKFTEEEPFTIVRDSSATWIVKGSEIEKLTKMTNFSTNEGVRRYLNIINKMGINEKLKELGAKDGDSVRIVDFEFEYKED